MTPPAFLPAALQEYDDAVVYLETCELGLGAHLVSVFDGAMDRVAQFPQAAPLVAGRSPTKAGARWVLLAPFPIKVIYAPRDPLVIVLAVFHAHRRPGYWIRRLRALP